MAEFKPAYEKTFDHEKGYSVNPNDTGGETYDGISRRFHPEWQGWKIIDKCKNSTEFPINVPRGTLKPMVFGFYKRKFWDRLKGDDIPDQDLAEWVFDIGVNGGLNRAGRFLQNALNWLNRNERDYPDVVVDGKIGKKTINAIRLHILKRGNKNLLLFVGCQMVAHWMNRIQNMPSQEEFANGIANRWVGNIESLME